MRIVVDTNIIFSAILNTNSNISQIILQPRTPLNFYSTEQLKHELIEHWEKLKDISQYSELELHQASILIISKVRFINVEFIPKDLLSKAEEITRDIDIDDTEFVALTEHIKGKLWTGDKALVRGLRKKNWKDVVSNVELNNHLKQW
ncbi:MAG: PIN domain-containing protein [Ginsengibacter sp.]